MTSEHMGPVRRLTTGEYFLHGWNAMWRNAGPLFTLLAVLVIPWRVLESFYPLELLQGQDAGSMLTAAGFVFLELIGSLLFALAASVIIDADLRGERLTAGNALNEAWSCVFDGVTTSLYMIGMLIIGLIVFIIPAIYLGVLYSFAITAVALRGRRNFDALRYSKRIVDGQWWRVFGVQLLLLLIMLALMAPFIILSVIDPGPAYDAASELLGALADPLSYAVITVFFLNEESFRGMGEEDEVVAQ